MQQNLQQHKSRSHHPHITKRYTGGERIGATVIGRWTQHVAYAAFTIRWKHPSIVKHDAGVPCVLSAIAFLYLPLLFFVCHCSFLPTFACSSVDSDNALSVQLCWTDIHHALHSPQRYPLQSRNAGKVGMGNFF